MEVALDALAPLEVDVKDAANSERTFALFARLWMGLRPEGGERLIWSTQGLLAICTILKPKKYSFLFFADPYGM